MTAKYPGRELSKILFRKRRTLSADSKTCSGCGTCEVICSLSHEGSVNPERSRIHIRSDSFKGSFIPMICHQCADAPCYEACPESAIKIDTGSGAVSIHEEKCTGCRACEEACPFKAIRFDQNKTRVFKCDLCRGDPECVNWCPMNALGITEFGGTIPK
jgi:anaerobic carbon-monoxide dehydrogenase iron sulfur subunit